MTMSAHPRRQVTIVGHDDERLSLCRSKIGDNMVQSLARAGIQIARWLVGQHHLTDDDAPIGRMLARGRASSIIFQGPPGTGKTTMARIIADTLGLQQRQISAVTTGIADLRKIVAEAQQNFEMQGKPLVLFVDEIHRWAKNVMDGLLGPMESGAIVLIAATTENVGFSVQDAVISRSNVYETFAITSADLEKLVDRVEAADAPAHLVDTAHGEAGQGRQRRADEEARQENGKCPEQFRYQVTFHFRQSLNYSSSFFEWLSAFLRRVETPSPPREKTQPLVNSIFFTASGLQDHRQTRGVN